MDTDLSHEDVDTIGGWFLTNNIDSDADSVIEIEGYIFKIQSKDGHQIHYLEVKKV